MRDVAPCDWISGGTTVTATRGTVALRESYCGVEVEVPALLGR